MHVQKIFGILKERWHIVLNKIDIPLHFILNLVAICISLYNLYTMHRKGFDLN